MHLIAHGRMIRCNETRHPLFSPPHLHENPHQVIVGVVYIFATIVLYDHVMHDETSAHDVLKALLIPKSSRSTHNTKLGLQNPKYSLHIFPSHHLRIVKFELFLT
jgi:hypothetical protein